jgi:hypothetical protein
MDIQWRMDRKGLSLTNSQGWLRVPCDPTLNNLAAFNVHGRFSVPLHNLPERLQWGEEQGERGPQQLTVAWPEDYDFQRLLGKAEK